MSLVSSLILGLVQGLTEFLPVSSSGHLVIAAKLLDYQSPGLLLETVVHLATTLAVIIYFRKRFWSVISGAFTNGDSRKLVLMLGLAFATTAVIGIGLDRTGIIDRVFESAVFSGAMLLVTAVALLSVLKLRPPQDSGEQLQVSWKVAVVVGLAQGIAIFPGISRSGFTIVAGLCGGLGRTSAAEFSFMLSVPTILAASLFTIWRQPDLSGGNPQGMLIAGVVAFVIGLLAINWLMQWLRKGRLWWFSGYCAVIGTVSVVYWGIL